jgi:feruloyl esterase
LTQDILDFATNAVLHACDEFDGVADRLIEDPLQCNFSIDSLACKADSDACDSGNITCLTKSQLSAFHDIYSGPVRSDNGKSLYPGFSLGSETEWLLQEGDLAEAFSIPILQNVVYDDLSYDSDTFNWASDVGDVNRNAGRHIDEISPDLSAFRGAGGKLLVTQGWADPFNAALWPIEHLQKIEKAMGGDVFDWFELFMVPGGGHCGAASGYPGVPATYHTVAPLVKWVEEGKAPKQIRSTDAPDGSTTSRKLCPWPQTAKYVSGDIANWKSYVCQ